ncbi:IS3 family transposase, partial [Comamonas thiooxydans]|uniref:IS3 family transposase n=1 Tax=Comamonas thiooxydans TaxID=363952 RepID=UPI003C7ECD50
MSKYDESFKRGVVDEYLSGGPGFKALTRKYGVDHSTIRRWVYGYKTHGDAALQNKSSIYSAEFKLAVLRRMWDEELSSRQVLTLFDIRSSATLIRKWERQYHEGGLDALSSKRRGRRKKMTETEPPIPQSKSADDERTPEELRKENEYLRAEVAYLKKLKAFASDQRASRAEKARVVLELRQGHSLAMLLKAAGLSRSTFYYQRQVQQTGDRCASLKAQIQGIFDKHKGRYGYRRITAHLRQSGCVVNHKAVQRMMQMQGLKSLVRPKKYRSYRGSVNAQAPHLLQRQFQADAPQQKWVTDVTEFNVRGSKLYLSPVMDLYNGEIVAYEMRDKPDFQLVGNMLKKAIGKLKDQAAPLLHSDQGWQYQMSAYRRHLASKGITQSMSRKGNCLDNAAMESFFATVKTELFYMQKFTSTEHLRGELVNYIRYYN